MLIKSFRINHTKLKPGIYLHEIKQFGNEYVTTYDLRFKAPNRGSYLSNSAMHSLEHLIATFYSVAYPDEKIYFGPMGCQTGFYLVVAGKKNLA
ncbi:MAG: S-ribosylhomocysteine lyase [Mycoplasmoidaceae bacterium]|nr:S-ribosylhomocysteine lyase [Mycoplasmoidaceae bacterium]